MFFDMTYRITVGKYRVTLIDEVEIRKSVDLLAATATIRLPGAAYNRALRIEEQLKRGDKVVVELGYNGDLRTEFEGYLLRVSTDDGSLTLMCEDDIFLTRAPVPDTQLNNVCVKEIAEYVCQAVGDLKVNCTYDFRYDNFIISRATGFDVLSKLQEETKANIYIREGVLHIHPAFIEISGKVTYDFFRNIESSDLEYKDAADRKYEVVVEGIGADGKRMTVTVGTTGGDRRSVKVFGVTDKAMLQRRGEEELKHIIYTGYEGSITGWLIPVTEPGYSLMLLDADYEYKEGRYYVVSVTTRFSRSGGSREVELGPKLSGSKTDG